MSELEYLRQKTALQQEQIGALLSRDVEKYNDINVELDDLDEEYQNS